VEQTRFFLRQGSLTFTLLACRSGRSPPFSVASDLTTLADNRGGNEEGPWQPRPRAIVLGEPTGSSIEEGHVLHRLRLPFRVHQNLMPAVQGDGGVVGVPDAAPDVHAGVPPHRAPPPTLRLRA